MNTRYLPGTGLACATGALCSVDGARAQADRSAPAASAACASAVRGPVAGQAVPGLAIEEKSLPTSAYA